MCQKLESLEKRQISAEISPAQSLKGKNSASELLTLEKMCQKLESLERQQISLPSTLNGDAHAPRAVHQVEKYLIWEFTHPDKRIADTRCGWSKQAWLHHRRNNVPIKNQAKGAKYQIGPLIQALSVEMKRSVKTKLSNSTVISGKKTSTEIEAWFKHPDHAQWFEELEDELYIKAMDEKFQVATPAALFRLRIPANIKAQTDDGYPYYPEKEFALHSDLWINLLAELQDLDQDLSEKNMKDAFIETIRPCKLLFNEASRLSTNDCTTLIATLSDWLSREQQKCTDVQNAVNDLEEEKHPKKKGNSSDMEAPSGGQVAPPSRKLHEHEFKFQGGKQMNQAVKAFMTMFGDAAKGGTGAVTSPTTSTPLTGPGTNRDWECTQCGNWWDSKRKVPCLPDCKYRRHPKFKARRKDQPWPKGEPPLSYKGIPYDQIDEETRRGWDADKARRAAGGGGKPSPRGV